MKKEYLITYSIGDVKQRSRFQLLIDAAFGGPRKKYYKTLKYYNIKSMDDEKEMERKLRLIANEIMWEVDDGLEIYNLSVDIKKSSLWCTDEEMVIIRGDGKLEEAITKWLECYFSMKQLFTKFKD